jgi:hypothetical protein
MVKFDPKEFDPKLGSWGKGIISSIAAAIKFLVLPLLLITIFGSISSEMDESWSQTVVALTDDMLMVALAFGAALTALSFPRGFYPKGSFPRLIFSIICGILALLFGYMLTLGGDVQAFFDSESLDVDVMFLFLIYTFLVVLRVLQHISELPDYRWEFLTLMSKKLGTPAPAPIPVEEVEKHRIWHDFRIKYGRWSSGFKDMRRSAGGYIAWPLFMLMIAGAAVTKIGDDVPVEFTNELDSLMGIVLVVGVLITVLMFFKGFYPKGSISRPAFWSVAVICICLWIWYFSFGGDVAIEIMDVASVDLNYTPIVMLFIVAAALWAVYAIVEMLSYRKEWVANNYQPVDEDKAKKKKKAEKEEAKAKKKIEKAQEILNKKRDQGKE